MLRKMKIIQIMSKIGKMNFTIKIKKERKKFYLYKMISLIKLIRMQPYQEILKITYIKSQILMTQIIFVSINYQIIMIKMFLIEKNQDKKYMKRMQMKVLNKIIITSLKQRSKKLIFKQKNKRLKLMFKIKKLNINNKNYQKNNQKTNYKNNQKKRKENKKKKMKKKITPKYMENLAQTKKLMIQYNKKKILLYKIFNKK